MKNKEIIRLFFLSLEEATLFPKSMFLILSISETSVIAETLAFCGQLSIIYPFPLQLNHLFSFMSFDILTSKFLGVGVIDPRSILDRYEKKTFLLDTSGTWIKNMTAFKGLLSVICTIVEDMTFFLI